MPEGEIVVDDPRAPDVRSLLAQHVTLMRSQTPIEDVHALDVEDLLNPSITFFGFRRHGQLLAVGAIKELDAGHAELKSMHTIAEARRQGIGRAMVEHLVALARERGYERVSIETGSMEEFVPARLLYAQMGFERCGAFGEYAESPNSAFMTLRLGGN